MTFASGWTSSMSACVPTIAPMTPACSPSTCARYFLIMCCSLGSSCHFFHSEFIFSCCSSNYQSFASVMNPVSIALTVHRCKTFYGKIRRKHFRDLEFCPNLKHRKPWCNARMTESGELHGHLHVILSRYGLHIWFLGLPKILACVCCRHLSQNAFHLQLKCPLFSIHHFKVLLLTDQDEK